MNRRTILFSTSFIIIVLIGLIIFQLYQIYLPQPELDDEVFIDKITIEPYFTDIQLDVITNVVELPSNDSLLITEKLGRLYTVQNYNSNYSLHLSLDISDKIVTESEMGLLGLAIDPNFDENGYIFLYYTVEDLSVLSRFVYTQSIVNQTSEEIILEIEQPFTNHNGGQLAFGSDGYLYWGLGDGGSAEDPFNNGQSLETLLGSILRINVTTLPYTIPDGNPFINKEEASGEIYAYGFRNPWRFSFDRENRFWVADVGQNNFEEVNVVQKGGNYGWNKQEGYNCRFGSCEDFEQPVFVYDHELGFAIIGGYVYYGNEFPSLAGKYIFGDYYSGRYWAYDPNSAETTMFLQINIPITGFGQLFDGSLLIFGLNGIIYKFVSTE